MEDALRDFQRLLQARAQHVLILVLMEDALRVTRDVYYVSGNQFVLILVLMEDALRASEFG